MLDARYNYSLPTSAGIQAGTWAVALLMHGILVAGLILAWPQAREWLEQAQPIQVRLLDEATPPEPAKPPPPPKVQPRHVQPSIASLPPPPVPVQAPHPEPVAVAVAVTQAEASVVIAPAPAAPQATLVSAASPAAPAAPAPVVEPLVEARFDADYLSNPRPAYPMASRRLGEEGTVRLRVHVGPEGQALRVELKASSGFPRLDQSALDTVARWNFVPARRGKSPVACWVVVPIVFSLT